MVLNEKKIEKIRNEMENVRELYIKGFINKKFIKKKQENFLKLLLNMELKNKDINKVKESINKLNNLSQNEKRTLIDSIEMLWLNAGVQKKI